jgi:Restriction endonuclease
VRSFANFSPYDFELFIADLFGTHFGIEFETFPRGADGGIDLRYISVEGDEPRVVQCKHYAGSPFASLVSAAKKEAKHLKEMWPQPATYQFVTTKSLTAANKRRLMTELQPWIGREQDVLGANDLEALLDKHPEVERRQVKLWLTGGTQLAALLSAGTIQRSQTLLEEIQHAMPRYVQGRVFSDARKRLREQRVLVVAGIPGIGKTTLGRMLLADAVLDGYEPIEVSSDIEEGWNVLDASAKQVFLYDDFLGRTALSERFAKNEDRRLIDFMRRTTRSPSSLFILTTREYILRQATELYERLGHEKLDSERFLLELPDYTPLDRAQIFANHVFHSPRLDRDFRRALLVDKGYKKIVYHPNYNPRTIELITGLTKQWDRTLKPADYVEYALHTLEHPTLIWRAAFEHELDNHGRALVLTLVSLPRRVSLAHLETAFVALCRELDLSLSNRAFERTLASLDDSLLKTSHESGRFPGGGGVVVEPYDPSVIDFVAGFLMRSPEDVRHLAKACVFFEQAIWLKDAVTNGRTANSEVLSAVSDALRRTYRAPAISLVSVSVGPSTWSYRPFGTRDLEQRLLDLHDIARETATFHNWWRREFELRRPDWEAGQGEPESLLRLLGDLADEDEIDMTAAATAAKAVLVISDNYVLSLEWLHELWSSFPEAFDRGEWDRYVSEFEDWLRDGLRDSAEDMSDPDELELVERTADLFGLHIDDEVWADAEEHVTTNKARRDAEVEDDPVYEGRPSASDTSNELQEIEAIFVGLAD